MLLPTPIISSRQAKIRVYATLALLLAISGAIAAFITTQHGLIGQYYENTSWQDPPKLVMKDLDVSLQRMQLEMLYRTTYYGIRWAGYIYAPQAGVYEFAVKSDDVSRVVIDGANVVENDSGETISKKQGMISLAPGFHAINVFYAQYEGKAVFQVYWTPPGKKRESINRAVLLPKLPSSRHRSLYYLHRLILPALKWIAFGSLMLVLYLLWIHWQHFRFIEFLCVFWLLNGVVLNLWLSSVSERTTLYFTKFFLTSPIHTRSDSWQPMYDAFEYAVSHRDKPLYQPIFFERGLKFQYPPSSLLVFFPIKSWPFEKIAPLFNGMSWGAIWLSMALLTHILIMSLRQYADQQIRPRAAVFLFLLVAGFALTFYPLMRSFQLGQVQTWLYALFVAAVWAWLNDMKGLSGVCIGLIAMMKPQLGVVMLWGVLRRQWRFVLNAAAIVGVIGLASLWMFGLNSHLEYLSVLSFIAKRGESYFPNHSINGLLNRWFGNGANVDWTFQSFAPYHLAVYIGTYASSLLLIGLALFYKGKGRVSAKSGLLDFAIASLSVTMASPVCWEHHYTVLLPLFAVALPAAIGCANQRQWRLGAIMGSYMLCSNFWLLANRLAPTLWNPLQSYILLGALLFLATLYVLRHDYQRGV
ncbi:putative integral membrane protein [Candidatus Moduliflexus flocculans]|uniref:Putative integral membrane protein n=1 Tax=Candidatus Moduliflexus flocculans TaxID=1499966 RepID=A0A081BPF6_9BACT|nr:putative integral membrane protein [Candidatus Moduliflexus flocculans]